MRLLVSLALAAVMLVAGPAAAQAQWAPYSNAEQGFSADMPGTPTVTLEQAPDVGTTHFFTAIGSGTVFLVAVSAVPEDMLAEADQVDQFVTGVVDGAGGRETSRVKMTVSGQDARLAAFDLADGKKAAALGVIHNGRAYLAMTLRTAEVGPDESDRFVRSLRLLD